MTRLSDELLLAYVDGQLDKPQAGAVAQLARDDYDIAARVKRLQETQSRFSETFSAILRTHEAQPFDAAIRLDEPPARVFRLTGAPFAAIFASVAALVVVGYATLGPSEPTPSLKLAERIADAPGASPWQSEVATLHSFLSRDTLTAGEGPGRDVIAIQLSQFIPRASALTPPDFTKHGLTLARSQVLNYQGARFMQLAYSGAEEQPVALYVMAGGTDARLTDLARGEVRTVGWSAGGVSYVLAGFLPQDAMRALAVAAQNQLGR
ncbi:MAG: hypothetical protein NW215_03165 [Hyphomicrobiales bacterium]|nr:hypothetical protein [Hyphomicrobiales bacterium]